MSLYPGAEEKSYEDVDSNTGSYGEDTLRYLTEENSAFIEGNKESTLDMLNHSSFKVLTSILTAHYKELRDILVTQDLNIEQTQRLRGYAQFYGEFISILEEIRTICESKGV